MMRPILIAAAAAAFTAGMATAQYKTPPSVPPQGSVQTATNPNIQVTYPSPEDELAAARRIPREDAVKMVKEGKAVYIDVRSKEAYEAGHIPGATSVPLSDLLDQLKKLPPHKFLIAYCA